jgi:hypothetical protein
MNRSEAFATGVSVGLALAVSADMLGFTQKPKEINALDKPEVGELHKPFSANTNEEIIAGIKKAAEASQTKKLLQA